MNADSLAPIEGSELVDWRTLPPARRRAWWMELWSASIALAERYRLTLRAGWWQDPIQVEALAAFCCWLRLYDTGAETDPTGKLQLLWELERLRGVLRSGEQSFDAARDRPSFELYLIELSGGQPTAASGHYRETDGARLGRELATVVERLRELRMRERVLGDELSNLATAGGDQRIAQRERLELRRTIRQLAERERDLTAQLASTDGGR
jgi:hypothetical protein